MPVKGKDGNRYPVPFHGAKEMPKGLQLKLADIPIRTVTLEFPFLEEIENAPTHEEVFSKLLEDLSEDYGTNARRINYKKMAIIYTVHDNIVYIHRIIPASLITSL